MRLYLLPLLVFCAALQCTGSLAGAPGQPAADEPPLLADYLDTLSFALGVARIDDLSGLWIEADRDKLRPELIAQGAAASPDNRVLDLFRATHWLEWYSTGLPDTPYGHANRQNYKRVAEEIVRQFAEQTGSEVLPGGILRHLDAPGSGPSPGYGDYVRMGYTRYDCMDSKKELDREIFPYYIRVDRLFHPGLSRAVTGMTQGEKAMFYIPWQYSYPDESLISSGPDYLPLFVGINLVEVLKAEERDAGDYRLVPAPAADPQSDDIARRNPYFFRERNYDFRAGAVTVTTPLGDTLQVVEVPAREEEAWLDMFGVQPSFFVPVQEDERLPVIILGHVVNPQGLPWPGYVLALDSNGELAYAGQTDVVVADELYHERGYFNHDINSVKQYLFIEAAPEGLVFRIDCDRLHYGTIHGEKADKDELRYIYGGGTLRPAEGHTTDRESGIDDGQQ
ncbi:MAG: hypothetical protein LUE10_09000 [Alistipes sp.]|nr:hypothetical protein [Alistipes sp.]